MAGEVMALIAEGTAHADRLDTPVLGAANADDSARFSGMLATPDDEVAPVDAPYAVDEAGRVASNPGTLGDSIIRSMEAMGRGYTEKSARIKNVLVDGAEPISTIDLIRLQFDMIDTSIMVDLISKTVQKSTQHIDQLTKLQ
jgi:hypothetical protein